MRGALLVDMQQPHLFAVRVALSLCILSACLIKPGIGIQIKTKQKQTKAKKNKTTTLKTKHNSLYQNYKFASLYK